MSRLPALFLSHGAPTLALEPSPARDFLAQYGNVLGQPRAILVASAHWETAEPQVSAAPRPETIHDFSGFPAALYRMRYDSPGAPDLAARVAELTGAAIHPSRGLDHGAWVPLSLMYPGADIPTLQLSIQSQRDPAYHLELGRKLAPLRDEGVLVIGSGSLTHNLWEFRGGPVAGGETVPYVAEFSQWMAEAVEQQRLDDLLDYRTRAPHAQRAHPTDEHLLPLYVAMGAGGAGARVHASTQYGMLAMDVYAFA